VRDIHARKPRALLAAAVGLALCGAAGGAATAMGSDAVPPNLDGSPAGSIASVAQSDVATSFSQLNAQATSIDALPAAGIQSVEAPGGLGAQYGVNPGLSRYMGAVENQGIWLVPGSSGSCIWLTTYGMVCAPNSQVATQGLTMVLVPVRGGTSVAIGVLPASASLTATNSDGTDAPIETAGQVYGLAGASSTTTLTLRLGEGGVVVLGTLSADVPPTPPAQPSTPTAASGPFGSSEN